MNQTYDIPIWRKYTLTVEEAAVYFRIGENKLRNLINENKNANYLLWNGNRVQIKRVQFEHFIDGRCSPDSDNIIIYGHNRKNGRILVIAIRV